MGIKGIMRDAPSHHQTLRSKEAPDGTKRYGLWSPELKEERKTFGKFAFMVSKPLLPTLPSVMQS
jgi:hypothetical protein